MVEKRGKAGIREADGGKQRAGATLKKVTTEKAIQFFTKDLRSIKKGLSAPKTLKKRDRINLDSVVKKIFMNNTG
jgi:hypothetical protein